MKYYYMVRTIIIIYFDTNIINTFINSGTNYAALAASAITLSAAIDSFATLVI